ncbi:M23 family metallopeptidase [Mycobacterium sp. CVI_P3]|uniref:M23 family metallopeptidase n=1 Tax=Mycobacterium pinniadriaticum TaxID=2994102 RepID=A0ABT3SMA9_9MYCO|nr:M23 family metallopeptidase [Mycobacterium pinniadriaticum]MCX2934239.1 M23 family metallopeptidase [Mycobacterium pinniadriaticum]MCX2940661.1 M23 family metallopeptidase [Mycobacterium pinniadriaticum]
MRSWSVRRVGGAVALCVLLLAGCGGKPAESASSPSPAAPAQMTPLIGSVPFAPVPFKGSDGLVHLVYELWVTNFTSGELTIRDVAVLDAASGGQIGDRDAASLQHRVYPAGARQATNVLQPGQAATVFMHVPLAGEENVPQQLTHRVEVTAAALPPTSRQQTEELAPTKVDRRTLPVLSAPLLGERYVGADGCCDAPRHTRAVLPINGQLYLAQRYAVDFEQADERNRIFIGDPKNPESYRIFGQQVHAVADGTVVGTRNDLPEQTPGTYPANIPIDEADGNFVVLDIGNGFFVNYAHMQPGSVRPKLGDKVNRGDVIGLVGNSGNSVAPHLHLHVMDGPSPLAAQGLPYLYDKFTTTGQVASTGAFDESEATGVPLVLVPDAARADHTDEMVLDQNLVTFTR